MTKDEIKKALVVCTNCDRDCKDCPYNNGSASCIDGLLADCLVLITEYETRLRKYND